MSIPVELAIISGVCRYCESKLLTGESILTSEDEYAHVKCIQENQLDGDFAESIAVISDIGELKQLIEDLPGSMKIMLRLDSGKTCQPVFAVEKKEGSWVLEIRKE